MRCLSVAIGAASIACLVAAAGSQSVRAAVGQAGLTPVPCATRAWEGDDAAFEALPGAKGSSGKYEGGVYRIEIPDNWNGDLVLWAHGYVDDSGPQGGHLRAGFPSGGQTGTGQTFREHLI